MLLDFLRENDADCPVCGYNLRALTTPICPECGHELRLTVGATRLRMAWLFVAIAPCFFSGIAACFVFVGIVARLIWGDHRMSATLNTVDLFGFASGIFAILLTRKRLRFIKLPLATQRWVAAGVWLVHIAAFGLLLLFGARYA